MTAHNMLEQLLNSGLSMMGGSARTGGPAAGPAQDWGKFAAGTAVGGALGLLLGSKRGRKMGGSVLKVGGVAALGAMAYRAYTQWQAQQPRPGGTQGAEAAAGTSWEIARSQAPRTVDRLPAPEVELHSRAVLVAMIGAAKSDGHLDERERGLLEAELARIEADPAQRRWVEEEVRRPLDPAEVARAATSPELAAEMYLASLLVADETSFMERAYLDELARQLRLPEGLRSELRAQAAAA